MSRWSAVGIVVTLSLFPTTASIWPAALSPLASHGDPLHYAQVRAEYIDLTGNRDETNTTCSIVNKSDSKDLFLGDIQALGPNGVEEVLALDTGLNGLRIPPLGSVELPVDSLHFPGLLPKLENDSRGIESVVVSWSGPKDALRLNAAIHLEQPGNHDNRVINRVEGHYVTK